MKSEHIQEVLVISPFYPPHTGGLQTHAAEFNLHLATKGYRVTVATTRLPSSAPLSESTTPGVTVLRFPVWEIIGNYPLPSFWRPAFWSQVAQARRQRPQLVISRTRFFFSSFIALLVSKMYGVPLVHVEHGSDFVQLSNPILRRVAKAYDLTLGRLVLRRAFHVVANSTASQKFVARLSGRHDTTVIYRGIDKKALARIPADLSLRQSHPEQLIVVYIGRLIDGKGIPTLLQALANIRDLNIQCIIIGDGPAKQALQRLTIQFNLASQVTYLGDHPWPAAMAYLKGADVFINPSLAEGLPTGVIEAALCERLVIATHVGGTPEIITDRESGLLIKPGDAEALAFALQEAKDKNLRDRLGSAAARAVASRFNWAHTITMYDELIHRVQQRP